MAEARILGMSDLAGLWRYASALLLFVLACSGLATSQFNPFIYFRF